MINKYLLEIGTEELPYKFISSATNQLKEAFTKALNDNKINFSNIITYSTPRRLCVIVEGISESQPDICQELKGPPANIAFDNEGKLTNAGLGFAKKINISPEQLSKKDFGGTEYVVAVINSKGQSTKEVLSKIVPEIILNIQGARFMRWANLEVKFSRPVRWLVSILGEEEVKIKIGNAESSKYSRGHRFSKNKEVLIQNPDKYIESLYNAEVIANQEQRKEQVEKLIIKAAEKKGGIAQVSAELLDEVVNLVEWPTAVVGSFEEKYLEITEDVIVCVLAHHQRYFPVFSKEGKLLNYFITIANHDDSNIENIKKGNEKVVKPRLDDAIFFYKEDTKRSLESRIEDLKGITFQKGLGNLYDKTLRIANLSEYLAKSMNLSEETASQAKKAAMLCKADLSTNLVREFTELQGIIGGDYAKLNGEPQPVWQGVREHYMPISAEGELAASITGQIVGIADKIDTICGVFALGKAPTGSADPLGLRRAALGIINTILECKLSINLPELVAYTIGILPLEIQDKTALISQTNEFILLRFKNQLCETYKIDVIEAVLRNHNDLCSLSDVICRAEVMKSLIASPNYKNFHEAANRILRIIKNQHFFKEKFYFRKYSLKFFYLLFISCVCR